MIYIATIHWKTDRWIDIQQKYLARNMTDNYRVFAYLDGVGKENNDNFYFTINQPLSDHGKKLNILTDAIIHDSKDENDIVIFLDGDAFPIDDLTDYLLSKLKEYPLIAIKREENMGDVIAHPSFCATTIGFWKEIAGNWEKGYRYKNQAGRIVADVGGSLYLSLQQNKIVWYPLLRTNKVNFHPLFFGIYDNIIYHHGAGFRDPVSSVDLYDANYFSPFNQIVQSVFLRLSSPLNEKTRRKIDPFKWKRRKIKLKNIPVEKEVFSMICNDEDFFRIFRNEKSS